ncbi:hypothetical protein BC332_18061 [Capsicum chinense]|nr:hypothetical protein BC332_18061 [Capsicum chinense]
MREKEAINALVYKETLSYLEKNGSKVEIGSYIERVTSFKKALLGPRLLQAERLKKKSSPSTDEEKKEMSLVPYSYAVGSLMYAMVCTRPDIARYWAVLEHNVGRYPFPYGKDIDNYLKEAYYSADRSGEPAMITKLTKAAAYANLNHSIQSEQQCEEEMNSILLELDLDGDITAILPGGGAHVTHDGRLIILIRDCGLHIVEKSTFFLYFNLFSIHESNVSPSDSKLESQNHSHSTGFEIPRLEDLWDIEQHFKAVRAPFDDQGTMNKRTLSELVKNGRHNPSPDPARFRSNQQGIRSWTLNQALDERYPPSPYSSLLSLRLGCGNGNAKFELVFSCLLCLAHSTLFAGGRIQLSKLKSHSIYRILPTTLLLARLPTRMRTYRCLASRKKSRVPIAFPMQPLEIGSSKVSVFALEIEQVSSVYDKAFG